MGMDGCFYQMLHLLGQAISEVLDDIENEQED